MPKGDGNGILFYPITFPAGRKGVFVNFPEIPERKPQGRNADVKTAVRFYFAREAAAGRGTGHGDFAG